ncbi:hypothetical protein A2U01_0077259, partial [Trifolium medium]|nr:hypothetical protein [Trifolium medium]
TIYDPVHEPAKIWYTIELGMNVTHRANTTAFSGYRRRYSALFSFVSNNIFSDLQLKENLRERWVVVEDEDYWSLSLKKMKMKEGLMNLE